MLQDITQTILAKTLDAKALRNKAIANNLANVETPNYTRQDVSFENELRAALNSSEEMTPATEANISAMSVAATNDSTQPVRENGNNVDVDREMARLADNEIQYQTLIESLSVKNSMLRTAIYEGRR